MSSVLEPLLLSLLAGSSTAVGAMIVILLRRISSRVVSFSLGFASGVMLLVAFLDLFLEAVGLLTHFELLLMFSVGAIAMIVLDVVLPHVEPGTKGPNSESYEKEDGGDVFQTGVHIRAQASEPGSRLLERGRLIALGITLHNFPEGLVVAAGYSYLPKLGIIIAIAVMLHNIPEGLATAILLRAAGMKSPKVFILTLLSGLTEPLAAFISAFAFSFLSSKSIVGYSLAFAAGVMTYITADELIPLAHEYGHKHTVSISLLLGIMFALLVDTLLS